MAPGHRSGPRDWFNRARQRLWFRRTREPESASASWVAPGQQWDPPSGPYLQQVMPGWRAGMSWRQLACCLSVLALLNGGLTCSSFVCWVSTTEVELDYTSCADSVPAVCRLTLRLGSNLTGPVYVYYGLSNAYFNHRRIQTAWNMRQLLGLPVKSLHKACHKRTYRGDRPILPCGDLPNAIFNDTFAMLGPMTDAAGNGTGPEIPLSADGISWRSHIRGLYRSLAPEQLAGTVQPDSWPLPADQRYRRPFADAEDLQAWLLTPAFASFRKLSHRVLPAAGLLPNGSYRLVIGFNYPVGGFGGAKRVIVTDKSPLGGKNIGLVLLPAAASACYLLLCISTLIEFHCRHRKRMARQASFDGE